MSKSNGFVSLVGAGPGDPGLLTLRAAHALQTADVLLYDALASDATIALASRTCEKIFVGKRGGNHAMPQDEIEALMIRKAREGNRIVRLKGGDPFVFGRGGEEAQTLAAAGIPFEIVPGITSAIAAPAYAGIPVTHREHNVAFTVVTGHEDPTKPESTLDWARLANPNQTLVLLMAMGNLEQIVAQLRAHGLPADRPVAVIREGTRPTQQTLVATLETIVGEVQRTGIGAPSIVIVGDVVTLRDELRWFDRGALFGKRVLVTRPSHQSVEFAQALWSMGAHPVLAPTIEIVAPGDEREAVDALGDLHLYGWLVFTSANGVEAFFRNLHALGKDARAIGSARIAAIGPKTAAALASHGIIADLVPARYVAEEVAHALLPLTIAGERILVYRAEIAREELISLLEAQGREVRVVAAYATQTKRVEHFERLVESSDILTFTSASTVKGFVENAGGVQRAQDLVEGKVIACIGPITAAAAREFGFEPDIVADEYTAEGLLEALVRDPLTV